MLEINDKIRLPLGIRVDGQVFRDVVIDEMTGFDEELLVNKKHRNNGARAMTQLLRRVILEIPGLAKKDNPTDLLDEKIIRSMAACDRDFTFLSVRLLSMEPTLGVQFTCPSCEATVDREIRIEELDVYEWPDGETPLIEVRLPIGIRDADGVVHKDVLLRFATGEDQERLVLMDRSKMMTALLASCIVKIGDGKVTADQEVIRRMKTRDRQFLAAALGEHTPGVDLRVSVDCPDCEHEWEAEIDVTHFFNVGQEAKTDSKPGSRKSKLKKRS